MVGLKYIALILLIYALIFASAYMIKGNKFKLFQRVSFIFLMSLLLLELALSLLFRFQHGNWLYNLRSHPNKEIFQSHPYLAVSNRKNIEKTFQGFQVKHNADGYRSPGYTEKDLEEKTVIVTIGGSTTYGVGVSNDQTWPYILDELLGDDSIVINMAVPGYSTIENIISASLYLDKYQPDVVILHTGLNDMRTSNVHELHSDYSNFHYPHLIGSMGLCYLENVPRIASIYYLVRVMQSSGIYPICAFHSSQVAGQMNDEPDTKALDYYKNNLTKLIQISKLYSDQILVVPQVLNEENVKDGQLSWWIPFVPPSEVMNVMRTYNTVSLQTADTLGCAFLFKAMEMDWDKDLYTDPSHLNVVGNQILAVLIRDKIRLHKDE